MYMWFRYGIGQIEYRQEKFEMAAHYFKCALNVRVTFPLFLPPPHLDQCVPVLAQPPFLCCNYGKLLSSAASQEPQRFKSELLFRITLQGQSCGCS